MTIPALAIPMAGFETSITAFTLPIAAFKTSIPGFENPIPGFETPIPVFATPTPAHETSKASSGSTKSHNVKSCYSLISSFHRHPPPFPSRKALLVHSEITICGG